MSSVDGVVKPRSNPQIKRSLILAAVYLALAIHIVFAFQVHFVLTSGLAVPRFAGFFVPQYLLTHLVPSTGLFPGSQISTPALCLKIAVAFPASFIYAVLLNLINRRGLKVRRGPRLASSLIILGCAFFEFIGLRFAYWILLRSGSIVRLLAGVMVLFLFGELLTAIMRFCHRLAGLKLIPNHNCPIASRSLREFWGQRWNHIISVYLNRFFFLPLARCRHPALGILCAFLASGIIHALAVLAVMGVSPDALKLATTMASFFLVQGLLVLAETPLRMRQWPGPLARIWTLGTLLVTSPLIIGPSLRVFDL
jgi:Membrane bound O-acyl transferase family